MKVSGSGHTIGRKFLLFTGLLLLISPMIFSGGITDTLSLSDHPNPLTATHLLDVMNQDSQTLTVQRVLKNTAPWSKNSGTSNTIVVFSAGDSGDVDDRTATHTNGSDKIHYNFYDSASGHHLIKDAVGFSSSDDGLVYQFPDISVPANSTKTQTKVHDFIIEIPDGQYVPAGKYQDSIDISLYKDATLKQTVTMTVTITVEKSVKISIVDVGAAYNPSSSGYGMDFGTLSENEYLEADAVALANTPYSISTYSYYGSKMKHETVNEYIPYTLSVDGTIISITTPMTAVPAVTNAPMTPSTGTAHRIKITISAYGWVPSGDYEDNLVFEITEN